MRSAAADSSEKLAFLRRPASYPGRAGRVEAIETHMSWVFLTSRYAYKLKKPVRLGVFDARSLAARRRYCEEEVRLNRRLAPGVYLGIVALSLDARGQMQFGAHGHVVDWLVKMRRLPARQLLDRVLRAGMLRAGDLRRVAARMAGFYRAAPAVAIDARAYRARFEHEIERSRRVLCRAAYGLPAAEVRTLCQAQQALLGVCHDWFDARVAAGRIVEGHGDLRPEHVCLAPRLAIIDSLEFSPALRTVDPADELGFLALECERLGNPGAGAFLLRTYAALSGDRPHPGLVHFYQGFRAALRARLAIRHLDEEAFRASPKWRNRALVYLRLAQRHQACADALAGRRA